MVDVHPAVPDHDRAVRRRVVPAHEQGGRRRSAGRRQVRQGAHAHRRGQPQEGYVCRCRRRGRGKRGAVRDRGLPQAPAELYRDGRAHPQGRAARRPSGHRQDAHGPRSRGRGRRAVSVHFGLGLCRALCRCRCIACARSVRPGQEGRPGHRVHRRDRRGRPPARQRSRRRSRRARADAQPAARRDGRLYE